MNTHSNSANSAGYIINALNGDHHSGMCRCPVPSHGKGKGDRNPSLSVRQGDRGPIIKCFGGCSRDSVVAELRRRGLWSVSTHEEDTPDTSTPMGWKGVGGILGDAPKPTPKASNDEIIMVAARIWRQTVEIDRTHAESYLRKRGISCAIPSTLRFHTSCLHPNGTRYPAMIAAVTDISTNRFVAVHRTFLDPDQPQKADVDCDKMMLASTRGHAVHLAPAGHCLIVSEGIETGLSVMQATSLPTWAALSATGLKALILPPLPLASEVIIAADNDENDTGIKAARCAAARWFSEGRKVRIVIPPTKGTDFNDLIRGVAA